MTTYNAQVCVIAGGPSGLAAAVQAAENGADVIVLEKAAAVGGAANMGMGPLGIGTRYQKANMQDITVEQAFNMFMEYTHYNVDARLIRRYFGQSADTIEWLEDMGVEFEGAFRYFPQSMPTWHIVKCDSGIGPRAASFMNKALYARAQELGVRFLLETPGKKILKEHDRVVGVLATDRNGEDVQINCSAAIICTGGAGSNFKLIKEETGYTHGEDMFSFAIPGIMGDGLRMAWEAGADKLPVRIEQAAQLMGVEDLPGSVGNVMIQPNLLVNKFGRRFMNEDYMQNSTYLSNAVSHQPGRVAFSVIDTSIAHYYMKHGVPDGANILDCALDNGIYIPHLCHHKDLSPLGSCRMCVVEVEGREGVTPSCTMKAEDGLNIRTKSPELTRLRMLALELLLTGHPEDCSTCPKYGNCELQMLIQYIGPKTGRLKMRSKGFAPEERNPLILHDMNRCVLCGRCVRACNELRGVKVLRYNKRDMETYVGTLHDKLLIDADCRFCGACAEVCPTGTIRDKLIATGPEREDAIVPCRAACPAHTDVPRYIRFVKQGDFEAAAAVIREKAPFPHTLGLICNHVCELKCKRGEVNAAMSIRGIKRAAAEGDMGKYWKGKGKQLPDTGKKVCVVGGGPAGLTAAYYLRKQGHDVTVKEALPTVGGMMSYGIPSYRLPREVVAAEAQVIANQGVKFETNCKVEKPVGLLRDYDAVLMAIGTTNGVRLPMQGNDLPGVLVNIDFLRKAAMGQETGMGKRVIVLGGGNVAFDCARTAKRLGTEEIHLACLEARNVMTADDEEIEQAQEEGIFVHPAQTFERITGETHVTGVDFMNVESFTFDENRRAIIKKEPGSEHHLDADTVIFATGQRPDLTADCGLTLGRANSIAVADMESDKSTSVPGIFAAGDVIYGTKSVIQAIESGREAASQIDKYLGGDGDISETLAPPQDAPAYIGHVDGFGRLQRGKPAIDSAEARQDNFNQFDHGMTCQGVCGEAARCLQCDLRLKISRPRVWGDFAGKEG